MLCAFKLNKNSEWGGKVWFFSPFLSFLLSSSSSSSYSPTAACCRHCRHCSSLLFFRSLLTSASFKQVSAYTATTYNCLEVKYAHMHGVLYVYVCSLAFSCLYESLLFFFALLKLDFQGGWLSKTGRQVHLSTYARVNVTKSVMDDHDFMV